MLEPAPGASRGEGAIPWHSTRPFSRCVEQARRRHAIARHPPRPAHQTSGAPRPQDLVGTSPAASSRAAHLLPIEPTSRARQLRGRRQPPNIQPAAHATKWALGETNISSQHRPSGQGKVRASDESNIHGSEHEYKSAQRSEVSSKVRILSTHKGGRRTPCGRKQTKCTIPRTWVSVADKSSQRPKSPGCGEEVEQESGHTECGSSPPKKSDCMLYWNLCMQPSLTVRACPVAAHESDGVEWGRERFLSNLAHHIPNVVLLYGAESPLKRPRWPSQRPCPASSCGRTARCGPPGRSKCKHGPWPCRLPPSP